MKVDTHLTADWHQIPDHIKKLESQGYDGAGTAEMNHDPFIPLFLAAGAIIWCIWAVRPNPGARPIRA